MFLNLQKNRSQKLSMLEEKQTLLESVLNFAQSYSKRFSIFMPKFFFIAGQMSKKAYLRKIPRKKRKKINKTKIEHRFV